MWGDRVRAERVARKWRQQDVARFAGVSQSAVSRLELGSRRVSDDVRARLAHVLDVPVDELFPYDDTRAAQQLAASAIRRAS